MAKLVVDSSVAIKWFVAEPLTNEARRILNDYQNGAFDLLVPDLIFAEFGNIVWKKHMHQGLAASDAQTIINTFRMLAFEIMSSADLLAEAYKIAVAQRRTVYDALYIALSVTEQCDFVTADEKLVNAVGSAYSNVKWLAHRP
jgi:predicted nucleic acid-binding protein